MQKVVRFVCSPPFCSSRLLETHSAMQVTWPAVHTVPWAMTSESQQLCHNKRVITSGSCLSQPVSCNHHHACSQLFRTVMQACFAACARICVRELRKTETTDVIMVYSGTMHCLCAIVACIAVPGSVVILQHTWQVATLLATGRHT